MRFIIRYIIKLFRKPIIIPTPEYIAEVKAKLVLHQSRRLVEFLDFKRIVKQTVENKELNDKEKLEIITQAVKNI